MFKLVGHQQVMVGPVPALPIPTLATSLVSSTKTNTKTKTKIKC